MASITYKNPRRPDEVGVIILRDQPHGQEVRQRLERRGFVIVDDEKQQPAADTAADIAWT
jgi:hypothetical protein